MSSFLLANAKEVWQAQRIATAVLKLDAWLQSMRSEYGFTGPIAHWWESSLVFCGPMIDWRYEGILSGYVTLFENTENSLWMERARQAAEDIVLGQLPDGNFFNSSFQYGAMEGGTPHEASVDIGLLEFAKLLRQNGDQTWRRYFDVAECNINAYLLGSLWNGKGFQEQPWDATLVPNKNATTLEALVLYQELADRDMSAYIEQSLQVILSAQEHFGVRAGATVHTGTGKHRLAIGIYTARCVCALLRLFDLDPRPILLKVISDGLTFLNRLLARSGTFFGYYGNGIRIANPRWIAPSGDLLRAALLASPHGLTPAGMIESLLHLLLEHQYASGGMPTAYGFAERGASRPYQGLPEFRDVLPVVGWCDKAFRALALLDLDFEGDVTLDVPEESRIRCVWKGQPCLFFEKSESMQLVRERGNDIIYEWRKGTSYPSIYRL